MTKNSATVHTQVLGERFIGVVGGVQQLQGLVDFLWLHDFIPEKKFYFLNSQKKTTLGFQIRTSAGEIITVYKVFYSILPYTF
jgi:hypothetical protein